MYSTIYYTEVYTAKRTTRTPLLRPSVAISSLIPAGHTNLNSNSRQGWQLAPRCFGHWVHTSWIWWKNQPSLVRVCGARTSHIFHYIYHNVQSCGVCSSWERRYTLPISTLSLYVLCGFGCQAFYMRDTVDHRMTKRWSKGFLGCLKIWAWGSNLSYLLCKWKSIIKSSPPLRLDFRMLHEKSREFANGRTESTVYPRRFLTLSRHSYNFLQSQGSVNLCVQKSPVGHEKLYHRPCRTVHFINSKLSMNTIVLHGTHPARTELYRTQLDICQHLTHTSGLLSVAFGFTKRYTEITHDPCSLMLRNEYFDCPQRDSRSTVHYI